MKKLQLGVLLLLVLSLVGCQKDVIPTTVIATDVPDSAALNEVNEDNEGVAEQISQENNAVVPTETTQPPATETPLPPPTATPVPVIPITAQNLATLTRIDRLGKGLPGRFSLDAQGNLAAVGTPTGVYLFDAHTLEERLVVANGDEIRSAITAVALSPDGQIVAVALGESSIKLYDTATGAELRQLQTDDNIYHMLFSADGQNLIIASPNNVQIKNQVNGNVSQTLDYQYASFIALSQDNARLMALYNNPRVFDLTTGAPLMAFVEQQQTDFDDAALSPDGSLIAVAGDNLSVWRVDDGAMVWQEPGLHSAVAFSPDGRQLAAVQGIPGVVNIHSVADGAVQSTFTITGIVTNMAFTPEGAALLTEDLAGLTRWSLDGTAEARTAGFIGWALCMAVADGHTIALGGEGGRVELWDWGRKERIQQFAGHSSFVKGISLSADGKLVASIGLDNRAKVWRVEDGSLLWEMDATVLSSAQPISDRLSYMYVMSFYPPLEIAFSPNGRYLALAADGGVQLWDMESGGLLHQFQTTFNYLEQQLVHFAFSPDGSRLTYTYGLSSITVAIPNGESVGGAGDYIESEDLIYTHDGKEIVMLGRSAQEHEPFVQIWGTEDGFISRSYHFSETDSGWGGPLKLTPDGRYLILVDGKLFASNNSLLFFDSVSGQLVHRIWRTGAVYDYAFSADGSQLITGVTDKGLIEIWGIDTNGNDITILPTPAPTLLPVSYSCANVTEIPQQDCEALIALYQYTNGANWTDNSGWLQNNTPCSWFGVNCSMTLQKVSHVMLPDNNLQGTLPPDLGNFTSLAWLDLSNNNLTGSIPPELTNTSVENIVLGNNAFTGSIPEGLGKSGSHLMVLDLQNNQLSGSLPASLGNFPGLSILFIQDNPLSGPLPVELTNTPLFNFKFQNTQVCVPENAAVQNWLEGIVNLEQSGLSCNP